MAVVFNLSNVAVVLQFMADIHIHSNYRPSTVAKAHFSNGSKDGLVADGKILFTALTLFLLLSLFSSTVTFPGPEFRTSMAFQLIFVRVLSGNLPHVSRATVCSCLSRISLSNKLGNNASAYESRLTVDRIIPSL